ncbi:MAG: hypothetical protein GY859_38125, partial [Desulfobacterales bacterium]|nr:hypothetical protein [Desulfobacterales bacterium]
KDAVPDDGSNDFGGRGAWYQGVKLSLFDVSDPSNPREVDSLVYGKRGTNSDALVDHHALAYLPPINGGPARLALPIQLHETVPTYSYFNPSDPSAYYDWTHTGLYMFDITTGESGGQAGIEKSGHIIAESIGNQDDSYWGWARDRAVLLNDSVHYIHNEKVISAEWGGDE